MNLNLKKKGINNVQKKEGEKMKKAFDWNSCIDNWTTPECWLIFQK